MLYEYVNNNWNGKKGGGGTYVYVNCDASTITPTPPTKAYQYYNHVAWDNSGECIGAAHRLLENPPMQPDEIRMHEMRNALLGITGMIQTIKHDTIRTRMVNMKDSLAIVKAIEAKEEEEEMQEEEDEESREEEKPPYQEMENALNDIISSVDEEEDVKVIHTQLNSLKDMIEKRIKVKYGPRRTYETTMDAEMKAIELS